jgi:signal peptidase I
MSETKEPGKKKNTFLADLLDFLKTVIISAVVILAVTHWLVRPIRVEGQSMYPTLADNAFGFSNVIGSRYGDLQRFDIAIIYLEEKDEYLIKRIIGLPGETIACLNGTIYINGEPLDEPFLDPDYTSTYGGNFTSDFGEVTLGEGEYFCLGDNRPVSNDSRYYGPFRREQIVAKGALILWPLDDFGVKSW